MHVNIGETISYQNTGVGLEPRNNFYEIFGLFL